MTWWAWLCVWVVLVTGSAGVLFWLLRSLWRKAAALAHEFGQAAQQLEAVSHQLEQLSSALAPTDPELAMFQDPAVLRRERDRDIRRRVARARKAAGDAKLSRGSARAPGRR